MQLVAPGASSPFVQVDLNPGHTSNHQPGDVANIIVPVPAGAPADPNTWTVVVNLITHNGFGESDDHWDVAGVNVMTWGANQPEQCVALALGDPAISQLDGSFTLPATSCR